MAGFVILALVFSNVYAVVMRYIFNKPLHWPMDISEFLLVGTVFLGGAYTLQVDSHVNINILLNRLSSRKQLAMKCVCYTLIAIFSVVLTWKGCELAWQNFYTRSWSITRLPLFPSYAIVPIGGLFLLAQSICKLIKNICDV